MYVKRVRIRNIKGFADLDLDLWRPEGGPRGWTVLAGRNGSGKSTLLRSIALSAVGLQFVRTLQESFVDWIRKGEAEGLVTAALVAHHFDFIRRSDRGPLPLLGSPALLGDEDSEFEAFFESRLGWTAVSGEKEPELSTTKFIHKEKALRYEPSVVSESPLGWFLTGYGPTRRLTGHGTAAQRHMAGPDRVARLVSLFREDASLFECVAWLRQVHFRRLEGKPGAAELEDLAIALLNDGLLPDGAEVERVDSDGLWVREHGVQLRLDALSEGYQTTAALVLDLLRHLQRCYGEVNFKGDERGEDSGIQILDSGVVLIDEVALHLHVSWQQRIGFWLKEHFPNIQFIVTTHSPFVCQAADPGGLVRLPAPGEDRPVEQVSEDVYHTVVNGTVDDAVLTELFGLEAIHSEPAETLRQRVAELETLLQTGKASEGDAEELAQLRRRLPRTLASDVEQVLRRLEKEG